VGGDGAHGEEVGQKEAEAHGEEVGQKEAEVHGEEVGQKGAEVQGEAGRREDGREEEVGKVEDHDVHDQEAESAVRDARGVHLVRNDVHEVHNDGLGRPCQNGVQEGMHRFPRYSSSESHCGGDASDPGKRDLGLKGKN
jgi:hypothetical protein